MKKYIYLILILFFITNNTYSDSFDYIDTTSWVIDELNILVNTESVHLHPKGNFQFNKKNTRIEAAQLIYPLIKKLENGENVSSTVYSHYNKISRLVEEFSEELEFLGIDLSKLPTDLSLPKSYSNIKNSFKPKKYRNKTKTSIKTENIINLSYIFSNVSYYNTGASKDYSNRSALLEYKSVNKFNNNLKLSVDLYSDFMKTGDSSSDSQVNDKLKKFAFSFRNYDIGLLEVSDPSSLIFDKGNLEGIKIHNNNFSYILGQNNINKTDSTAILFDIENSFMDTLGINYKKDNKTSFFLYNINNIKVSNTLNIKNDVLIPGIHYSVDKNKNMNFNLNLALYKYSEKIPAIGLTDDMSTAFKIALTRKINSGTDIDFKYTVKQSGYTPVFSSNDFDRLTDLEKPLYNILGFNGNVNDIFLKYTKQINNSKYYIIFESMSQNKAAGSKGEIDALTIAYNKKLKRNSFINLSWTNLSKTDPSGNLTGDINILSDIKSLLTDGIKENIINIQYNRNF